jgi:GNAT superfamily N-acetyltransferase
MKEHKERNDFYADEALLECLDDPALLEELTEAQALEVQRLAEARVFEIYEPIIKARYQRLIQKIKTKLLGSATAAARADFPYIQTTYVIGIAGRSTPVGVTVGNLENLHQANLLGISTQDLVREESTGLTCNISDKDHQFWINLKMFKLKKRDGTEVKAVFIADWYVSPHFRGSGVGKQLQGLAATIARDNGCTTVFALLVPEDPKDLERLKGTNRKLGYEVSETVSGVVAVKTV